MSMRYKGGIISATAPTTTTSTASGVWSSENVFQAIGAVAWPRSPAAPTIGTATDLTTGGSVSVPFTAPSDTGSTAITSYASLSTPGSLSSTNSASPITATGLTNSTAYTFQVRATNSAGTGPYSGASNSVTPTLAPNYIEDVFSTWLYTGNGSTQTITNGIDLSGKGGLVWGKDRSAVNSHYLFDTARGVNQYLSSDTTSQSQSGGGTGVVSAFNANGFSLDGYARINNSGDSFVSWTFRKQTKFFDIVTYTGNGATSRDISHSLAGNVGFLIVKRTSSTANWATLARATTQFYGSDPGGTTSGLNLTGVLNGTGDFSMATSTLFKVGSIWWGTGTNNETLNNNGETYVAYLFAHNAGGFGLTGSDNVISCGSASWSSGSDNVVNLGYEAQWVMYKRTDDVGNWMMWDTMRGMSFASSEYLRANLSDAAATFTSPYAIYPNATGFTVPAGMVSTGTYIYIAIRRGPMKIPTVGTTVFSPIAQNNAYNTTNTTNFPVDLQIATTRNAGSQARRFVDRLRGISSNSTGAGQVLESQSTAAETTDTNETLGWDNTSYKTNFNYASVSSIFYNMRRAPSFFDEVCYTGTGSATTFSHNLGVVPELMIVKNRTTGTNWPVYTSALGATQTLFLNLTDTPSTITSIWNDTSPTASVFTVGSAAATNTSSNTYVAYLFATCAGVSKVGSYTGTAALLTVNCGFTAGARFVLIKRTDSTGDWYTYDSARGISSGNDPYLLLNSTAAETTGTNYVDTDTTGFKVTAAAPAGLNASGGTYIFLAIA